MGRISKIIEPMLLNYCRVEGFKTRFSSIWDYSHQYLWTICLASLQLRSNLVHWITRIDFVGSQRLHPGLQDPLAKTGILAFW